MPVSGPIPRLHGRDAELAVLRGALHRAASGRLAIVSVEGEGGIGKTRLLDHALDAARADRAAHVVAGRAEEQERTRPFGLWTDALRCSRSSADPRRAEIAALLAPRPGAPVPITASSDPGLQFHVVDAVVDLVEELAHPGPLVIGLDDLQWADPSSLLTVVAAARRLTHAPLALLVCLRPAPWSPELRRALAALDAAGAQVLPIGGLTDEAVRDLVDDVLAGAPRERLLADVAGAGGNPLFVIELLSAIVKEGAAGTAEEPADVARPTMPPSLRLTILRHLAFLPDAALDALRPAAILGTSFAVSDLSATTARSVLELSVALDPAIRAGVLVDDGDRLRFRHDLVREAVYADIPPSLRAGLHHEAGTRLGRSGAPALQVAGHLALGATRGDREAVAWLTRAAREAAARSPGVSADLLQRAIDLADPADPDRDRLVAERASSLWWAGQLPEAQAACRALLGGQHDPLLDEPARICLARTLIAEGRMADALRELEWVQQATGVTEAGRAAAWGWASMAHGSMGDLDGAVVAAVEAQATAPAGEHITISLALNSLAAVAEHRGQPERALQLIDDAVSRADRSPDLVGHRYPVHGTRGHILMELDRLDDARATLQAGRRIGELLGTRWALPSVEAFLAVERFLSGHWDDAIAGFEAGIDLAEETGERYSLVLTYSVLAVIALHRGDLRRAGELAERAGGELTVRGPRFRSHWATWVRGLLREADGDAAGAYAALAGCWDDCVRSGLAIEFPVLGPDLVRLALAVDERERAAQVAEVVSDLAAVQDVASHTGAALRCRGLVAGDPEPLLAAVDAVARSGRPLEIALAAEDAATALGRAGAPDAARPLLHRALDGFEALGATRDIARVEASLRGLGVRRGRRGPRARPRTGWGSLTPTERRVVALVAEGLTNPQIGERLYLSRRTVQTHVAHVFAKVDVSSRTQLAAEATRRRVAAGG